MKNLLVCYTIAARIFITASLVLISHFSFSQTITNPLHLPDEWQGYGIGDPYILKYRGKYWLYCSTRDDSVGVKAWSSWDLAQWNYEGIVTHEPISEGAYAPEVIYYNGVFYMYTSPHGNGHYILTSEQPQGPFRVASGNLGLSIDGNVFTDDDGSLFFTYAGIHGKSMSSPLHIDGPEVFNMVNLQGWTEGSTIFKRNGTYYLTYTGNHVLSNGYRVHYATADAPLGPYSPSGQGPIIINTEGTARGLGHSGSVRGPDLDTWYMAYHNLDSRHPQAGWPIRYLNLDPQAFNGKKITMYGPTTWAQQTPQLPAFYDRFERDGIGTQWENRGGGNWGLYGRELMWQDQTGTTQWYSQVTTRSTANDFTAEFNLKEMARGADNARFGAVFSYRDDRNFGRVVFSSMDNTVELHTIINGAFNVQARANLLPGWEYRKWHTLRLEKSGSLLTVFVDDMQKLAEPVNGLAAGRIGVTTFNDHADFGYTAFSNQTNGSGIFDFHKPIPGKIAAVHFNSAPSDHFDTTFENIGGQYRNGNVDIRENPEGGYNIGWNTTGEWYTYNVNVEQNASYHLGLRYATTYTNAKVRFYMDDVAITEAIALPSTGGWNNWETFTIPHLPLNSGFHRLRMETVEGEFDFYQFEFENANNEYYVLDGFNGAPLPDWNYSDGSWRIDNGNLTLDGWGKRTLGATGWADYTVEVDMQIPTRGNAGVIFRVQNPATGGAGDNPQLGADFYQGYYVTLQQGGVTLGKQNYDWQALASTNRAFSHNRWYHLRIQAFGPKITVFVDDMATPILEYRDKSPFISGKAGVRAFDVNSSLKFDNFQILP